MTSLTVRGRVVVARDGMRGSFVSFVDCCVKRRTDHVYSGEGARREVRGAGDVGGFLSEKCVDRVSLQGRQ